MAQFQVPQFIETEDKIVGPLTLRQFLYLAAAGAIGFILFFILKFFLWLIIMAILGTIAAAFAFIKINGQPLPRVFLAALGYSWKPKMYLWQREEAKVKVPKVKIAKIPKTEEKRPSLKDLWLKLTTSSKEQRPRPAREEIDRKKYEVWRKVSGDREVARRIDYR